MENLKEATILEIRERLQDLISARKIIFDLWEVANSQIIWIVVDRPIPWQFHASILIGGWGQCKACHPNWCKVNSRIKRVTPIYLRIRAIKTAFLGLPFDVNETTPKYNETIFFHATFRLHTHGKRVLSLDLSYHLSMTIHIVSISSVSISVDICVGLPVRDSDIHCLGCLTSICITWLFLFKLHLSNSWEGNWNKPAFENSINFSIDLIGSTLNFRESQKICSDKFLEGENFGWARN